MRINQISNVFGNALVVMTGACDQGPSQESDARIHVHAAIEECSPSGSIPNLEIEEVVLDGNLLTIRAEGEFCGTDSARLCWEGGFREESPPTATFYLEAHEGGCEMLAGRWTFDIGPVVDAFEGSSAPGGVAEIDVSGWIGGFEIGS